MSSSYGGTISVQTDPKEHSEAITLNIQVTHCDFINNQAENGGGAIYTSKHSNYINILCSRFIVNHTEFLCPLNLFSYNLNLM